MHNLFAFNVSKEVADLPTISIAYDPNQQVATWEGDDKVVAAEHCTQYPYIQYRCFWFSPGDCGQADTTHIGPRFYDSLCDP